MGILWIILIGFIAGIIARLVSRGPNNPSGFILTTVLGICGGVSRNLDRPAHRLVPPRSGAGFIGATVGALTVLFIWNRLVAARVISSRRWTTLGCMIAGLAGRLTGKSGIKYRKEVRFVL